MHLHLIQCIVHEIKNVDKEEKSGKNMSRPRFELRTACVLDRSDNQLHHRPDISVATNNIYDLLSIKIHLRSSYCQ